MALHFFKELFKFESSSSPRFAILIQPSPVLMYHSVIRNNQLELQITHIHEVPQFPRDYSRRLFIYPVSVMKSANPLMVCCPDPSLFRSSVSADPAISQEHGALRAPRSRGYFINKINLSSSENVTKLRVICGTTRIENGASC